MEENREALEELGYSVSFVENHSENFWASVTPHAPVSHLQRGGFRRGAAAGAGAGGLPLFAAAAEGFCHFAGDGRAQWASGPGPSGPHCPSGAAGDCGRQHTSLGLRHEEDGGSPGHDFRAGGRGGIGGAVPSVFGGEFVPASGRCWWPLWPLGRAACPAVLPWSCCRVRQEGGRRGKRHRKSHGNWRRSQEKCLSRGKARLVENVPTWQVRTDTLKGLPRDGGLVWEYPAGMCCGRSAAPP